VKVAYVEFDRKMYVQFVNNLFIVVMHRMLYKNSKRTLAGLLKYLFTKLLLMRSKNIYYVRGFFASFCRVTPKRFY